MAGRSIKILENVGFLKFDGYAYTLAENLNIDTKEVWKEWDNNRDKWLKGQNTKAYASLVDVTLRALPEILTGKTPATDIMFPNSSMNLLKEFIRIMRSLISLIKYLLMLWLLS